MSTGSQAQVEARRLEGARQQIDQLVKRLAQLAEQDVAPADFYGPFLQSVLEALAAPVGVVWGRTAQGNLGLQYQINLRNLGLDQDEERRRKHDDLLRQVLQSGRPMHVLPHSSPGAVEDGQPAGGNLTDHLLLMAPMRVDQQVVGLVEVWQRPNYLPNAVPGFMQFLVAMADLAGIYYRNNHRRRMMGQEQLWTQLETYALQVQSSLNPTEVAYLVANEGRRLLEADRLSVAVRYGPKTVIEAVSGVDVVEKRSKQVRRMRTLCQRVLTWNEKLVFRGTPDDSLPPRVVEALDAYLEESPCKLLVVMPLRDAREKESKKPARSALLMEAFEPGMTTEQMLGRLEVVGKHATRSLYNAIEYKRIPFRWVWMPMAAVQEGLGGKARAIGILVLLALALLVGSMVLVPYPLKMEAKGQLLPEDRRWVFSPVEAQIVSIDPSVRPTATVSEGQELMTMYDGQLAGKIIDLLTAIQSAAEEGRHAQARENDPSLSDAERAEAGTRRSMNEIQRRGKQQELDQLCNRTGADPQRPGYFVIRSPMNGTILNSGFRENLVHRSVKPSDNLIRLGNKSKRWEVELKISQKHIGQVLKAFETTGAQELDVDLLVLSAPTRVFKGKLRLDKVAGEANPPHEETATGTETEPVVLAWVRIAGDDIPDDERIPPELLTTGIEVHSKIRCGSRAMGYALFYGVWEFLYEKVVFFF
jgi:hypothetical protein